MKLIIVALAGAAVFLMARPAFAEEILATQESRIVKMHLETVFEGVPGLRVMPAGNAVLVDGEIDDPDLMRRIYTAIAAVNDAGGPIKVTCLARLTPAAAGKIVEAMKARVGENIRVSIESGKLILEGSVKSDFEADRAVEFAKLHGVDAVIDLLEIKGNRKPAANKLETKKPDTGRTQQP